MMKALAYRTPHTQVSPFDPQSFDTQHSVCCGDVFRIITGLLFSIAWMFIGSMLNMMCPEQVLDATAGNADSEDLNTWAMSICLTRMLTHHTTIPDQRHPGQSRA